MDFNATASNNVTSMFIAMSVLKSVRQGCVWQSSNLSRQTQTTY